MSRALDYATWVLDPANEKRTGDNIKLAAKRFLSDLKRDDIYFDEKEAGKFITFAEECCVLWEDKWRGTPVKITPWMAFIFEQVYGWHRKVDGLRRIRKVYVQVAKKNGKSSIAGVMALYHLFADDRIKTPKVFVGANNEDQAKICVNIAGKILEQSPDLFEFVEDGEVDIFRYKENIVNIVHRERDGFIKAMAKETESKTSKQAGGKHGFNPSLALIDEYAMADSAALLDALESAQAAREEPLLFAITTAGHKKDGPCFTQLRRTGLDVLNGVIIDDSFLPLIYEYDKGDQYFDQTIWEKANPNLGVSVFHEFLKNRVHAAQYEGGSKAVDVRTLNFNEWCDTPEVWIPAEVFIKNTHGFRVEDLEGLSCFGGLQLISAKELNALALIFPFVTETLHAVRLLSWIPQAALLENQMKTELGRWNEEGWIQTCPGNTLDNEFIFDEVFKEISKYRLHSLSFPVNAERSDIIQALVRSDVECNPISQGYRSSNMPTFLWEQMITKLEFETFGNPVLLWSNSQCMALRKGDDIRIERAGGRTAPIVACINALAQWKTVEAEPSTEFGITEVNL